MINFDLLAILGALLMTASMLAVTISVAFLHNDPPSAQVLKVWNINTKREGLDNKLLLSFYDLLEKLEGGRDEKKVNEYNEKMLRLGMETDYREMRKKSAKKLTKSLPVAFILIFAGLLTVKFIPIIVGLLVAVLAISLYIKPVMDIDRAIKNKNKRMKTELLSILDSFKIFNQAGLLNNIVKDNVDMLAASRNDLLILQATLESEGELVAFSEFGARVNTDLFKDFTTLVKTAIQGTDTATLIIHISELEKSIYESLERDMKEAADMRWRMVTSMVVVIFIPIILIIGAPVMMQLQGM